MLTLLQFCESRVPMVKLALDHADQPTPHGLNVLLPMTRYSVQQSFFYQADFFVKQSPFVSADCAEWVAKRYGPEEGLWGQRRGHLMELERTLARHERRGFSKTEIIYEHIYTGKMFWNDLVRLHESGQLTPDTVALTLENNYRTAWVTREENGRLPQYARGPTLLSALEIYRRAGIQLLEDEKVPYKFGGGMVAPFNDTGLEPTDEDMHKAIAQALSSPELRLSYRRLNKPRGAQTSAVVPVGLGRGEVVNDQTVVLTFGSKRGGLELKATVQGLSAEANRRFCEAVADAGTFDRDWGKKPKWTFWRERGYLYDSLEATVIELLTSFDEMLPALCAAAEATGVLALEVASQQVKSTHAEPTGRRRAARQPPFDQALYDAVQAKLEQRGTSGTSDMWRAVGNGTERDWKQVSKILWHLVEKGLASYSGAPGRLFVWVAKDKSTPQNAAPDVHPSDETN